MLQIVVLLVAITGISCHADGNNITCGATNVDVSTGDYHFMNPGYPAPVTTSPNCSVNVSPGPKAGAICMLEIIIEDLCLAPAENGECKKDQLIVSGGHLETAEGDAKPMVPQCGKGPEKRHLFFMYDELKPINVDIVTTGELPRKWHITFDGVPCFHHMSKSNETTTVKP